MPSLAAQDRLYLLTAIAVFICFAMAVRELRLARQMLRNKLRGSLLRSPQRWVGVLAPCVAAAALIRGCLQRGADHNAALAAAFDLPLVLAQ